MFIAILATIIVTFRVHRTFRKTGAKEQKDREEKCRTKGRVDCMAVGGIANESNSRYYGPGRQFVSSFPCWPTNSIGNAIRMAKVIFGRSRLIRR